MTDSPEDTDTYYPPIKVSEDAHFALARHIRTWSGLANAALKLGKPAVSPFASFDPTGPTFTANPERLVINPNRVYLTVTPFRLRQEAVLTGAMLHEASHARHTQWTPQNVDQCPGGKDQLMHGAGADDGSGDEYIAQPVSKQTLAFAKLLEEPRIEGIMSIEADTVGAFGLGWTMRASAAHLIGPTELTRDNDGQRIMDLITSWVLRAGRQLSIQHHAEKAGTRYAMPSWVGDFGNLLHGELTKHEVTETVNGEPHTKMLGPIQANVIKRLMTEAACAGVEADTGTYMVDTAREILTILFPETTGDEDDAPMPGDPMHGDEDSDDTETESISVPGPSDEQADEGESADESAEEGEGGTEGQGEGGEPGDGGSGTASETGQGEGDSQGEGTGEFDATAAELASLEAEADTDTTAEGEAKAAETPLAEPEHKGGAGQGTGRGKSEWQAPDGADRDVAQGAGKFLRNLINPSESSKVVLSEAPSATVDGQAMAVWKAGGQRTEPRFFARTRRSVTPSPPVKIAILVDVSQSMESLQKPSALLSWAMASAAIDLRNFAGRGVQVESTLIHWGNEARVIQANGKSLPGIRTVPCVEGTSAMDEALTLVDEQIPGFFDASAKPEHRLLVQFTDWELWSGGAKTIIDPLSRGLEAGVSMLSVVPSGYSTRRAVYDETLAACAKARPQRGRTAMIKYDPKRFVGPADVWLAAKDLLS